MYVLYMTNTTHMGRATKRSHIFMNVNVSVLTHERGKQIRKDVPPQTDKDRRDGLYSGVSRSEAKANCTKTKKCQSAPLVSGMSPPIRGKQR